MYLRAVGASIHMETLLGSCSTTFYSVSLLQTHTKQLTHVPTLDTAYGLRGQLAVTSIYLFLLLNVP